ncbi:MAG TPA: CHAT domain-containing tetratricopeptide repeat protein [Candidatus Polarisedimenticolaceae bacterium]|nr:CHAT domain-containing tetratricopeptide repeat protein [Candidatus Polarisedimenticolaceae bacterium]
MIVLGRAVGATILALTIATAAEPAKLPVPPAEQKVMDALGAGKADEAIAAMKDAIAAREAQATTDAVAAATALDDLGAAVFQGAAGSDASIAAASDAFRRALDVRTKAFGPRGAETAKSYSTMSTFAFLRGKWDEAEKSERQALDIRREALPKGDPAIAESLDGIGVVLVREGRLAEAEPLLVESVRTYTLAMSAPADKRYDAMNSLGELYRQQDRLDEAEKTFRDAIDGAEKLGPDGSPLVARLTNNLGGLLKDKGNLADAESLTRRSLTLREAAPQPDPADLSVGYLNLAEIYRLEGNAAEAEPLYLKSIELAKKGLGEDHPDLATHYGQLGVLYRDTGRVDEARKLSDRSIALLEKSLGPDHPLLAQALHDRGVLEAGAGKPQAALPPLKRALAIREKALGATHPDVAATLVEVARAESSSQPVQAKTRVDRAITILDASQTYPDVAIDARTIRAGLARANGDFAGAEKDLTTAAGTIESLRPRAGGGEATRAQFLAKYAGVYDGLVDLLLTRSRIGDAFTWSERKRGRALLEQLASAGVDLRQGIPEPARTELKTRETAARSSVAEWQARTDALLARDDLAPAERETRLTDARKQLATATSSLRRVDEETKNASTLWRASSGGDPATLKDAQALLGKDERFYVYVVGEKASWLIDVPAAPAPATAQKLTVDALAAKTLGVKAGPLTASSLTSVLDAPTGLLAALSRRPAEGFPDESGETLAALYGILVPQATRAGWKTAHELVIVPDAALIRLPFDALRIGERYWLDDGPAVRYAVSATLLRALAQRPAPATDGLLSVADPAYTGARWPRLPGTAAESDAVIQAVGIPAVVLRDDKASERAVRAVMPAKRFLHFAVHGVVDEGRGDLLAALALTPPAGAPSPEDDGLLQLFEIYDLKLDADLAVLSACATHAGTTVAGEGVFALSRGFLARGARRVVASQWEVDDASTAKLVAEFFKTIGAAKSPDYAAGLAAAKKKVRGEVATSAPFYWAAFVMTGLR